MCISRRSIPNLPVCPRAKSLAADVRRSYATGRREFSRVVAGQPFEVVIRTGSKLPASILAELVTTMTAESAGDEVKIPFVRRDDQTLVCQTTPRRPGLHSFWTRFSTDGGSTWQHDPVPDAWVLVDPPQVDQMRMYTLIPNASGNLSQWSLQLHNIKAMGFNTVHMLPLTVMDSSQSPYSAKDLFDVDPSYLDPASSLDGLGQLEQFIETAQQLNLRLCFDLVMNHVGPGSDIAARSPEWITPDPASPDGFRRAGWWAGNVWQPWTDLILIDYEHPAQQRRSNIYRYMTEYALFWAKYASQTEGFVRFDNLHSSDKPFVDAMTKSLHDEYPGVGIIAEYFTDTATFLETIPRWGLNLILATPWDSRFVPQLRDYFKYIHSLADHVRFFMPITSHDSGTPAQQFGSVSSTVPRYVASALMGTGATGITQGVEWGQHEKIEFIGKHVAELHAEPAMFGDFLRRVNAILEDQPALRRGNNCRFVDNNHDAVIAAFRKDDRPGKVGFLIVCNFDILHEHAIEADLTEFLPASGPVNCVELLGGESRSFASAKVCVVLPVAGAIVLEFKTTGSSSHIVA